MKCKKKITNKERNTRDRTVLKINLTMLCSKQDRHCARANFRSASSYIKKKQNKTETCKTPDPVSENEICMKM